MFEKVNPSHPDKIADRIAGALVDLAYKKNYNNPKIAVEVLLGHGVCHIISETSEHFTKEEVESIVYRIAGRLDVDYVEVPQDKYLANNQKDTIKCGDNGIFKGLPQSNEEDELNYVARTIYELIKNDGKYLIDGKRLTVCQSHTTAHELENYLKTVVHLPYKLKINPIGEWTGGLDVDTGATNRKLGSDMGAAVTGGGLHGKDLSKADVSVNIYAYLKAMATEEPVEIYCSIGDKKVDGIPYKTIVAIAREYIRLVGGFEKFAEWGFTGFIDRVDILPQIKSKFPKVLTLQSIVSTGKASDLINIEYFIQ